MKVYLLILLVAAAITYVSVPVVRHIALVTHTLTPVRSRDVHKVPVPRLGGVAMYVGMVAAIAVASHIPYLEGVFEGGSAWGVVTSGGLLCALGVVDDLFDLEWWAKLAGQALAASILAWQGVQLVSFPIAGLTIGSSGFSMVMTIFVVLTAINAVNFVDGLDGLAAGTVAIGAMAFFGYTYVLTRNTSPDSYASLAATLGAALIGICLGFLPHNFNPATIFMGDCGSMLLGLMSAATAIVVTGQIDPISISYGRALPAFLPVLLPLAMMLLPLTDMMLAVVRRVSAGKSPFHPDRMHIHHRLLSAGLTHRRVVLVMYMWTAAVVFPLAAWAFIETRQAILALGLSLIAAFVFTGFMRKTKREEPAKKSAKKTAKKPKKKPAPKQDLPDSVHPTKLPDKTDATPVVRVRSASTPVVDSSSLSAASSATASVPVVASSAEAGSAAPAAASSPSAASAVVAAVSPSAPAASVPSSAEVGSVAPAGSAASSATTAPRTRRSRLKPRSTTPPWLQSDEPAPASAASAASSVSTAATAASSAALNAPSSLSAPSTQSAPSSYFAANSPDELAASKLSEPIAPATQAGQTQGAEPAAQPRRRRAGRHAATTPEQPTQTTQAVLALTQPAVTPAAPAAASQQVAQAGVAQPSQQVAQAGVPQPSPQPAVPASPQPPSSPQGPYGAGANSSPVWQAPRNPNVRYDVVPNQSLWEDEEDDDTNPTGVPAI
ncbi:MAG: undecaprenyl/decaprenyl-phosphate alpha-N-acetylglucosaminyl 1-phosphate transferase [Actinomyces graevenitzii]|nr:undecaprenyl/decaprenyl-phosphate alpha-N-acetylglucosaminyl 1-phosphate transferase [Actinomyces graevenitzii]